MVHTGKFVKLALVGNGLALPVGWLVSHVWLEQFAYKTEVSGFLFLLVTMLSVVLVVISSGYAAWKSGLTNPIEVIKSE
jgi:putative ABC transport system permease protein